MSSQQLINSLVGEDKRKAKALEMMLLPPMFLDDGSEYLNSGDKSFMSFFMDKLAVQAVLVATYLELRGGSGCGDRGHELAMRVGKQRADEIKKLLGYPG